MIWVHVIFQSNEVIVVSFEISRTKKCSTVNSIVRLIRKIVDYEDIDILKNLIGYENLKRLEDS